MNRTLAAGWFVLLVLTFFEPFVRVHQQTLTFGAERPTNGAVLLLAVETNHLLNGFFLFLYLGTNVGRFRFVLHFSNHHGFILGD